ncbi:MAG: prephenate dehydratase [Gammaproteobacteria bacterium]|nr:prephenate dehydratase [Gammaproteobacteria bacterium]
MKSNPKLEAIRRRIDELDARLVKLINQRAKLAQQVAKIKHSSPGGNESFYRPEREAQVLRTVVGRNEGPLSNEEMARLFREVMSACLALEQQLRIAYLGPEGTFTQAAVHKRFGHSVRTTALGSIDQIFREVESGACHYGVVPVENSIEGVVNHTLDVLIDSPLLICGEVELRIHQHLLSRARKLDGIARVYSHQQSLAQCRRWLDKHLLHAERIPATSNAEAARLTRKDKHAAAIAGVSASEVYKLPILARNIEDEPDNTTRFLVLGRHATGRSGHDKTSLLFATANRPGALQATLRSFSDNGVNMVRIESRPSRRGMWDYVFFVDVDGHAQDEPVKAAIRQLESTTSVVKLLGSYPRSQL